MRLEPKAVLPFPLRARLLASILSQCIQPALDFAPSKGKSIFPPSVPLSQSTLAHFSFRPQNSDFTSQICQLHSLSVCFNLLYISATVAFNQPCIASYFPSCLLLGSLKTTEPERVFYSTKLPMSWSSTQKTLSLSLVILSLCTIKKTKLYIVSWRLQADCFSPHLCSGCPLCLECPAPISPLLTWIFFIPQSSTRTSPAPVSLFSVS